ncbi:MAG: lysophospholipid acyltransferase family protein [Candidatus Cloacimonadaceae bacterium]|nr:lysophospholipid acyltransferase family protein [Candidatus Cloacimonadaceae bacterium]MDP3114585.1 lysophospholipid acyltransferase family protein [Candidatus Cloacimonadaceae bacterium]
MKIKKFLHFFWHLWLVIDFFAGAKLIRLREKDPIKRRQLYAKNTTRVGRKFLNAFSITVTTKGMEHLESMRGRSYLAIANHVSYTDILVLSSLESFVFITSVEMSRNPFLGDITRSGGCLFTDRKKPVSLPAEIENFATAVKQGFKVVLFPEGTSTNGETIHAFRKSLFQVALSAKTAIMPICVSYTHIDGKPISPENRDIVCWYGEMSFAPHFWKLMAHRIEVEVTILPPIEFDSHIKRGELSDIVYKQIHDCYHQV